MLLKVLVVPASKYPMQRYRGKILVSVAGMAVIPLLVDHFGTKNSSLGHCIAEVWSKIVVEIDYTNCTTICTQNGQKSTLTTINV